MLSLIDADCTLVKFIKIRWQENNLFDYSIQIIVQSELLEGLGV